MKRILIAALVIVMMVITFTACSNNADPNEIIETPEYAESAKQNALFVCMGSELEINGIVVNAAALHTYSDSRDVYGKPLHAQFYVDRINGSIYVYVEDGSGSYATAGMVKTDYTYSGDLIVNGVKIPWLVDPADRAN